MPSLQLALEASFTMWPALPGKVKNDGEASRFKRQASTGSGSKEIGGLV